MVSEDDEQDMEDQDEPNPDYEHFANDLFFTSVYEILSGPYLPIDVHLEEDDSNALPCSVAGEERNSDGSPQLASSTH